MFENDDTKRVSKSADHYMSLNWKVLCLHSVNLDGVCTCGDLSCEYVGKHPATPNGQNDATTDSNVIPVWWREGTIRNVGVFAKPSGFFVIDIDPRNGGDESFEKLEDYLNYPFVNTVEAITGLYSVNGREVRGRHLYFKYDGKKDLISKFKKSENLNGIDIKFSGYTVLPPSRHASGVNYEWREGHAPWEIDMAPAPLELLEVIQKEVGSNDAKGALPSGELQRVIDEAKHTTAYGAAALKAELEELSGTTEGTRNDTLYAVARRLGQLIAGGELEGPSTIEALKSTAQGLGLSGNEISMVTDRSGGALEIGVQNPRNRKNNKADSEVLVSATLSSDGKDRRPSQDVFSRANILDWDVLYSEEPEPEDWYVKGILCSRRGHSLYSDAGLGKSLLMREIAACLAAGKETLGFPARGALTVLYLDYENNAHNDIKTSLVDMGFEASELKNLKLASFPELEKFDTPEGAANFVKLMDEIAPDLIVIDTVSRVIDGDENANDTWNNFYNHTGMQIKKRGIAYVRLDHEGKNASAGARGGSAKRGDVDIVWRYTKKNGRFRLTCEKSRGPIENDWVDIERFTTPHLGHRVVGVSGTGGHMPWAEMLATHQKFQNAVSIIEDMKQKHGKLFGQDKVWELYKEKCSELGITRKVLWDALEAVKTDFKSTSSIEELDSEME